MTNQSIPRRDAKLSRRLRTNETERVRLVRENDGLRKSLAEGVRLLGVAQEEIKRLKKDRNGLNIWTQEACSCGGSGPKTDCLACQAYHAAGLKGMGE